MEDAVRNSALEVRTGAFAFQVMNLIAALARRLHNLFGLDDKHDGLGVLQLKSATSIVVLRDDDCGEHSIVGPGSCFGSWRFWGAGLFQKHKSVR